MHKFRKISVCVLLVIVIVSGAMSLTFAYQSDRGVWFHSGDVEFVPAKIPYLEAYATYQGTGLYHRFRAIVGVNVNSSGYEYGYGDYTWNTSYAYVIHRPCYGTDSYTWTHYYEYEAG
jgi:hypothetical protein